MAAVTDAAHVEVGVFVPQVGFEYDEVLARARWIEELGFDSMWLFDHLFFEGMDAPVLEGWTLATAVLAETSRLRVGHLVLCANFRHPVLVAKMAATLDVISGGRLVLGMGSGSMADEHRVAGLPWGSFAERTGRLEESLAIVTGMWGEEPVTHHGRHFHVEGATARPRPAQRPRPPIVVGGGGTRTLELVARYADWWNCPTYSLGDLDGRIAALGEACARLGRDPSTIRLSTESVLALAATDDELPAVRHLAERRFAGPGWGLDAGGLVGTPATVVEQLHQLIDRGVTYFVFFLHDRAARATLELLAERVLPELRRH